MHELRARAICDSSTLKVIAVERVEVTSVRGRHGWRLFVSLEPMAVVVCSEARTFAIDSEARPADLDELRADCPRLDAEIARFDSEST